MKNILLLGTDISKVKNIALRLPQDRMRTSSLHFGDVLSMVQFIQKISHDPSMTGLPVDGLVIVSDLEDVDDLFLLTTRPGWIHREKPLTLLIGHAPLLKQTVLERLIGHIDFVGESEGDHAVFASFVLTALEDKKEREESRRSYMSA